MKIQTNAILKELKVNNQNVSLASDHSIELEFSAIDTGGGFKDPMIDFSIALPQAVEDLQNQQKIDLELTDPNHKNNEISFSFEGDMMITDRQINGRIKEDQLSKEAIGFVLHLLR